MAKLRSTTNQGQRGLPNAQTRGKVSGNRMGKPALAANLKNSQGIGGGLKQGKGGAKYVSKARGKGLAGLKQSGLAAKRVIGPRAKTNLPRIKAQPKSPKNLPKQPKNNFTLHNSVGQGDVSRLRAASKFPPVKMGGGKFGSFIGGK